MKKITANEAFEKIENMEPIFLGQKITKILPDTPEFVGKFIYGDETGKITGEGYYTHGKWCAISMKIECGIDIKKTGGRHMIQEYDNYFKALEDHVSMDYYCPGYKN